MARLWVHALMRIRAWSVLKCERRDEILCVQGGCGGAVGSGVGVKAVDVVWIWRGDPCEGSRLIVVVRRLVIRVGAYAHEGRRRCL